MTTISDIIMKHTRQAAIDERVKLATNGTVMLLLIDLQREGFSLKVTERRSQMTIMRIRSEFHRIMAERCSGEPAKAKTLKLGRDACLLQKYAICIVRSANKNVFTNKHGPIQFVLELLL